jgi:hypothetical protein
MGDSIDRFNGVGGYNLLAARPIGSAQERK